MSSLSSNLIMTPSLVPEGSDQFAALDAERMARYRQYLDFYHGLQWEGRRRRGETRITANYARTLVRKAASYVFPRAVTFAVPPAVNPAAPEATCVAAALALNELSGELDLPSLDFETLIDSSVLGDGCFKVTWDAAAGRPLVTSIDPATLYCWTRPDNVRALTQVTQRYLLRAEQVAEVFHVDISAEGLVPVIETWTAARFRVEVAGAPLRDEANPYGWIPYVVFPNLSRPHELWGESDLADLLDICTELNRRLTVLARILQVSGNPIVVLENVSGSQGIRTDEGAVWEIPQDAKAYLLDMLSGGGVQLHIAYIQTLYRTIHDLAETPRTAFGDTVGSGALSGVALEVELQPLIQKVERKRRVWDRVYRQRNRMLLDLLEHFGARDFAGARQSTVIWPDILPGDRDAAVRNEVALVTANVRSRQAAMAALGEVDVEREWATVRQEQAELGPHGAMPGAGMGVPA